MRKEQMSYVFCDEKYYLGHKCKGQVSRLRIRRKKMKGSH